MRPGKTLYQTGGIAALLGRFVRFDSRWTTLAEEGLAGIAINTKPSEPSVDERIKIVADPWDGIAAGQ